MTPERFRQLNDLFHAALSRDDASRASFVDEACAADPDLRDEVVALLEAHRRVGQFGEHPVPVLASASAIPLAEGTALGPYRIETPLGAGGMGEVYKATDTRLERTVAIKVLPEHVAADPESRQRFEREAKTVASLSHPHICPLFDVGEQDGIHFLVMEYLDGETLSHRLKSGALPLSQALRYASEIADALDKAHRRGIVHRDLKPSNVMLTATGAKLLDFGLAKLARSPIGANRFPAGKATGDQPLTGQGSLVGTLPYMAPEQVQGVEADARTDIFAFGAVFYEMVTGARAFDAPNQASLIASILKDDVPPASARQPMSSPAMDGAIRRCLAKDRDERWQSASDLKYEIQRIATETRQLAPAATPHARVARRFGRERLWWAAAVLAIGGIAAWFAVTGLRGGPPPVAGQTVRFAIALPDGLRLLPIRSAVPLAVSPGGERIVFAADDGSGSRLYVRELQETEIRTLPGTEGGFGPFFSPDGTWVGFAASGALKKIKLNGGAAMTIAANSVDGQFGGGSWGRDGTIVYAPTRSAGLSRISAAGGTPTTLTAPDGNKGEVGHFLPDFLPDGRAVLFTMRAGLAGAPTRIEVLSLDTGERRVIAERGNNAHYAPTGHVVFAGDGLLAGSLWAVPFNTRTLVATGPQARVLDALQSRAGLASFAMAATGTLAYVPRGARAPEELVWVGRAGADTALTDSPGNLIFPRLSPDGKRLAVTINQRGDLRSGIWVLDLDRPQAPVLFSSQSRGDHLPVWTPDGARVVFSSLRDGADRDAPANLYWKPVDDSGEAERLTQSPHHQDPGSWSPDGRFLTFAEQHPDTRVDIWLLDIKNRTPRPLVRTAARERHPMISPDGRWLAYASDETGVEEVYVQAFPDGGQKLRVSTDGGNEPLWARDGGRLFYRRAKDVVAVSLTSGPALSIGPPEVLLSGTYEGAGGPGAPNYEVSPDGRRFLMVRRNEIANGDDTRLEVVVNWFAELLPRLGKN